MIVVMVSFSFPFQLLISYIYAKLTNRNFVLRFTSIFDMFIVVLVSVWFEKFEEYSFAENRGMGLTDPPHGFHIFMQQMLQDNKTGDFHFDRLLAATAFFFWMRMLLMLILTNTFGPLITITLNMTKDLFIFFVLFGIELVAFACIGILAFGELHEYESLPQTLVMFIESSMGNFDFTIYDESASEEKKWQGIIFHIIVTIVNMLLMLNLVIAIMTDTYRQYAEVKLGLFSQGIIEAIPSYRNDKRFGALIAATPPFNLLTMFCLPIMLMIKDHKKQENFNQAICKLVYFPVCIATATFFCICNFALVPFAFVKTLFHKFLLHKRTGRLSTHRNKFLLYLFTGIPMLMLSQITDLYWFIRHSYKWNM